MPARTKALLGLLGVLLLITLWVYFGPGGGGTGGGGDTSSVGIVPGARRPAAKKKKTVVEEVEELRVADLAVRARNYSPGRDPWRFFEPPPPPPPPPPKPREPSPEELEQMRRAQEELRRRQEEEAARLAAEAAKPKPPPLTLSYMGNFGPAERRIAVFSDGNDIINAREGEVIQGKFIVARIGYESVDIRFVGFPDWPAQRLAVGPPSR